MPRPFEKGARGKTWPRLQLFRCHPNIKHRIPHFVLHNKAHPFDNHQDQWDENVDRKILLRSVQGNIKLDSSLKYWRLNSRRDACPGRREDVETSMVGMMGFSSELGFAPKSRFGGIMRRCDKMLIRGWREILGRP